MAAGLGAYLPVRQTMSGSLRTQALSALMCGQLMRRSPAASICTCRSRTRLDIRAVSSVETVKETGSVLLHHGKKKPGVDVVELSRNVMADLLEFSDYSPAAMAAHMSHFDSVVKRHLGPPPDADNEPVAKSYVTDDYGPIEFSLDWRRDRNPLLRYIVEPLSSSEEEERTSPIKARVAAARTLLHEDVAAQHGDHQVDAITALLWEHYLSADDVPVREVQPDGPVTELSHDLATQIIVGWDLGRDGTRSTKSYIVPRVLSERLRQPSIALLARLLPSLDPVCSEALGKLLAYISSRPEERRPKLMLVATDVQHPSHPNHGRFKIYFLTPTFFWPDLLDFVGLGCGLPAQQAELYTDLWTCATGAPPATTMEEARGLGVGGFHVAFDLLQGHGIGGRSKLYIPSRYLAPDDSTTAAGLEKFLKRRGYQGWQGYTAMIANKLCPHRPLSSRAGLQTFVSCSFKKYGDTDPSITAYIHQETYASERFE